jgi:hypothetical protein
LQSSSDRCFITVKGFDDNAPYYLPARDGRTSLTKLMCLLSMVDRLLFVVHDRIASSHDKHLVRESEQILALAGLD